jgi:hypothetical protein
LPEANRKADGSRYESGTEWEYEDAVSAFRETGSPYVLLYRRKQPVLLDADDPAFGDRREQYERVKQFFAGLGNDTGYNEYAVPGEFRARLEYDLRNVIARILAAKPAAPASSVAPPEPWTGSPFPGLRAFTADDEPIFFGRERETDALIVRILEHRFVAVVGASGSGKSSLVAAGVIPRLQRIAGSTGEPAWLILQLTPDALGNGDPFTALAAEIRYALPRTRQKALAAKLREQPDFLATVLPPRTLVFVGRLEPRAGARKPPGRWLVTRSTRDLTIPPAATRSPARTADERGSAAARRARRASTRATRRAGSGARWRPARRGGGSRASGGRSRR